MIEIAEKLEIVEARADTEPRTLVDIYEGVARAHPKPDTVNYKREGVWHSMSAGEMLRHSRSIALGLHSLGIRRGDRVALLSESRVEWVLADQGCIFAGAVGVPIYPTLTPPQVAYILKDSGARALFISTRAKFEEMETALRDCSKIESVILFDPDGLHQANCLSLSELEKRGRELKGQQPLLADKLAEASRPDDLATIIYTS